MVAAADDGDAVTGMILEHMEEAGQTSEFDTRNMVGNNRNIGQFLQLTVQLLFALEPKDRVRLC